MRFTYLEALGNTLQKKYTADLILLTKLKKIIGA